jgi:hypothetical protein
MTISADTPRASSSWAYSWDRREHVRASREVIRHARSAPFWRHLTVAGLVAGVGLALYASVDGSPIAGGLAGWAFIVAVWMLLFRWVLPWANAWQAARNDPATRGEIHQSVDEGGFTVHASGQNVRLEWSAIPSVRETRGFFLVFFSRECAYYLPKRAMSGNDCNAVRDTFRRFLPGRAHVDPET